MDTLQMKYFITAAQCLNFTDAANQLFITQPTLSRQITSIETELNMQLFIRDRRNVRLTPAGEYLYQELSSLYEHYCQIIDHAKDKSMGLSGSLNIGILDGHMVGSFLPDVLRTCYKKYPNMKINLTRGSFKALSDGVYSQSLDMVITLFFDIIAKEKLCFETICQTVDCIAVHKSHPNAGLKQASFRDFKDDTLIVLSPEDSAIAAPKIIEMCRKDGFYPNILYAPNLETIMLMVEAGVGIALINDHNALSINPNVRLIPHMTNEETSLVIAWHQDNFNERIQIFLEELKDRR